MLNNKTLEFAQMFLVVLSVSTALFFYTYYTYDYNLLIPSLFSSTVLKSNSEPMQQIFIQSFRAGFFISVSSFLLYGFSLTLELSLQTVFKTLKNI